MSRHITEYLREPQKKTLFSVELTIPSKQSDITAEKIFGRIDKFMPYQPTFLSLTSRAHERIVTASGSEEQIRLRKDYLDTNVMSIRLMEHYSKDIMPHVACLGYTPEETEDSLRNLHFHGIRNILAIKGDIPAPIHLKPPEKNEYKISMQRYYQVERGHQFTYQLVEQIQAMNEGEFLTGIDRKQATDFCIGVTGYPEGHYETPDWQICLDHLKSKVDAGANFVITQMFFDNEVFYRFLERAHKKGIHVPIIPGIAPLTKVESIESIIHVFKASIPKSLLDKVTQYAAQSDREQAAKDVTLIGAQYAYEQIKELAERTDTQIIHFFTMSLPHPTTTIMAAFRGYEAIKSLKKYNREE
jgi:methylenetetrahydrofolate reductase (NADPH)